MRLAYWIAVIVLTGIIVWGLYISVVALNECMAEGHSTEYCAALLG